MTRAQQRSRGGAPHVPDPLPADPLPPLPFRALTSEMQCGPARHEDVKAASRAGSTPTHVSSAHAVISSQHDLIFFKFLIFKEKNTIIVAAEVADRDRGRGQVRRVAGAVRVLVALVVAHG